MTKFRSASPQHPMLRGSWVMLCTHLLKSRSTTQMMTNISTMEARMPIITGSTGVFLESSAEMRKQQSLVMLIGANRLISRGLTAETHYKPLLLRPMLAIQPILSRRHGGLLFDDKNSQNVLVLLHLPVGIASMGVTLV